LIIDELESELEDIKSGNRKINEFDNNIDINNNTGINTNRLKQLSVSLNNTSLINHLKKENERLRKLVVTYEFKTKRFNEESKKKNKIKKNLININNHFYFSIINPNTALNTKTNTNSNSTIIVNENNEAFNNSNEKPKTLNNIKINQNKNSVKEIKDKKFKKESKIIKETIPKPNVNMNINNYTQINNNKKKKNNNNIQNYDKDKKYALLNDKSNNNIEKERTSSVIQRQKNAKINNIKTNFNNYNNLTNKKLNSKNVFSSKINKSLLSHNKKKYKKDHMSRESRNYSRGLNKHFNNSFIDSLIDNKYLKTMINTDRSNQKNNFEHNHSMMMRTIDNEKIKTFDISKDYITITKISNTKDRKENKNMNDRGMRVDLSGQKNISSKFYNNTSGNEFGNFKVKKNNLNISDMKRKASNKKYDNKNKSINKNEKAYNSYNLIY
jgi:hypothetical protein